MIDEEWEDDDDNWAGLEDLTDEERFIIEKSEKEKKIKEFDNLGNSKKSEQEEKIKERKSVADKKRKKKQVRLKERERLKQQIENSIKNIESKTSNILWKNPDKNGEIINGFVDEDRVFEIKKGLSLYELTITNVELSEEYRKKTSFLRHTSPEYSSLKNRAEKILNLIK